MSNLALLLLLATFCVWPSLAKAGSTQPLCRESEKQIASDPWLRKAIRAAYPSSQSERTDNCVFPYAALVYVDQVVLLTLPNTPGWSCHGCPAELTATFFARRGDDLQLVRRGPVFARIGSWGNLNRVHAVKFRNEDGVIVEAGMSNQGTGIDVLHVFIFRGSGARELTPREGIATQVNNCGAVDEGEECYSIEAAWRADPGGRVVVHYTGHDENKRQVDQRVVYELRNNKLELVFGQVPSKIIDFR